MAARREKGLCFNYDSMFVLSHKCIPVIFLCLVTKADDQASPDREPPTEVDGPSLLFLLLPSGEERVLEGLCISFHCLTGQPVPFTLKLVGMINGQEVIILVDSGSTNNFIQSRLAAHLHLTIQPSTHMKVTMDNGKVLSCGGECTKVYLTVCDVIFTVDLILLSINATDLVLGVQ